MSIRVDSLTQGHKSSLQSQQDLEFRYESCDSLVAGLTNPSISATLIRRFRPSTQCCSGSVLRLKWTRSSSSPLTRWDAAGSAEDRWFTNEDQPFHLLSEWEQGGTMAVKPARDDGGDPLADILQEPDETQGHAGEGEQQPDATDPGAPPPDDIASSTGAAPAAPVPTARTSAPAAPAARAPTHSGTRGRVPVTSSAVSVPRRPSQQPTTPPPAQAGRAFGAIRPGRAGSIRVGRR